MIPADEMFPLSQARKFPPYNDNTAAQTIHRHVTHGVKAIDRRTVKLKARRWPSGLVTCRAWIEEFVDELNRPATDVAGVAVGSDIGRKVKAEQFLDAAGL